MNISKLYAKSVQLNSSLYYKICKAYINLFFPIIKIDERGVDDNSDIIVTLTSHKGRINAVHFTVKTLLRQTMKPQKIILWLAETDFPNGKADLPQKLLELEKYGLSIEFCDNLFSHKKYFYTKKNYPNKSFITVDDDVFYPENLVENLVNKSKEYPGVVCCNWCHEFVLDENEDVFSYSQWQLLDEAKKPSFRVFPIGVGGVLYPPNALNIEVLNKEAIKELCLSADDMWLKAMAVLNTVPAVKVSNQHRIYFSIVNTKKTGLYHENVDSKKSPKAWKAIMERYPECRKILIREMKKENEEK